jgi:lysyl-tRNA synthetase, class II
MHETEHDLLKVRRDKLQLLREEGIDPYGDRYIVTHQAADIAAGFPSLEESKEEISTAGRIITKRGHGKAGLPTFRTLPGRCRYMCAWTVWAKNSTAFLVSWISAISSG